MVHVLLGTKLHHGHWCCNRFAMKAVQDYSVGEKTLIHMTTAASQPPSRETEAQRAAELIYAVQKATAEEKDENEVAMGAKHSTGSRVGLGAQALRF
jgi:hypothetical protein